MTVVLDRPVNTLVVKGGVRGSVLTPGKRGIAPGQPSSGGPGGGRGSRGKGGGGSGSGAGNQLTPDLLTIQIPASTGPQTYNVGFRPKLLIMFGYGASLDSDSPDGYDHVFGAASGASNQYCASAAVQDNVTSNAAARIASVVYSVQHPTHSTAPVAVASLVEFTSQGFTLNWTTVPAATRYCFCLAIGRGTFNAHVVQWTLTTGAGNITVSGVPFQPTLAIHVGSGVAALDTGTTNANFNIGAMVSTAQWAASFEQDDGGAIPDSARYSRGERAIHQNSSNTGIRYFARYSSFNSDGFTIVKSSPPSANTQMFSICFNNINSYIGFNVKPTGAAPATDTFSSMSFTPKLLLVVSTLATGASTDTGTNFGKFSMGVATATEQRCTSINGLDSGAVTAVQAARRLSENRIVHGINESNGVVDTAANRASFNSNGFTLTWDPNPATAYAYGFVALG